MIMITALVLIALMGLLTWASVYITKADIEEANKPATPPEDPACCRRFK